MPGGRRIKRSTVNWTCLFAAIQVVAAGRRSFVASDHHSDATTFTRLGRLRLSRDSSSYWDDEVEAGKVSDDLFLSSQWEMDSYEDVQSVSLRGFGESPRIALDDVEFENSAMETSATIKKDGVFQIALPLVPSSTWESLTGSEFEESPEAINQLAKSGLYMATQEDNNEWIDWKATKDTEKTLALQDTMSALDQGDVLVYIGKAKREGYGGELPIIKTKSILPLSAEEMADLLMDSSKVKIYNKLSLGRIDLKVLSERTKIVRNLTQPPIAKSKMVSVTLMHARPLQEDDQELVGSNTAGGFLCVSRAVPGADPETCDLQRNDILLGVNLLQELGPNECMMTTVTHVYSPALPKMIATKFGVNGAINFVKDIRAVCVPAN
jgi:hypothetical protein